jgi:hypothetical protein
LQEATTVRVLSSAATYLYKVFFPAVWIGVFTLVTLLMFIAPRASEGDDLRETRWFFLAITLVGSSFFSGFFMRLKKVALSGDSLVITNFRRQIVVPLRDVERVSGSIPISPELMWLHFRHPTDFGTKIVFMPPWRFFGGYTRHPLVRELNTLIEQASRDFT